MNSTGLPQFIIIGAVKGATTWLHHQLQHHPRVYLPAPEPHFFSQHHEQGLDFYRGFFSGAAPGKMLGEKSADYLAHPLAAKRIAETLPDVRLVVQLRNPVDRAYSDYKMLFRRGTVTRGPEAYLHPNNREQPRFIEDGLYAAHLKRWLKFFPREQLLVLLFEDVKRDPIGTVSRVCDHLGLPVHYSEEIGDTPRNDSSEQFLPLRVRTALAPLKEAVRPLRGNAMFEGMRRVLAREIRYPPLSPSLRSRLTDFYADDVAELENLIGRDLSTWRAPRRQAA
ncbi:sulfotransferase family protein [Novosphingobium sp. M1R2S20]|uniref:Sulfotransferase n=1 Tax=Novosphingobium rhizovicinum TaxID=3228928 RepID=A0ABV3RG13_9SPHN